MKYTFGYDMWQYRNYKKKIPIEWDDEKVVNAHFLLIGGSGMGKTYTIRQIVRELAKQSKKLRIHVVDVHGDIDIGSDVTSTVNFSEVADYGLNPLKISDDMEFGGVRKRVRQFISMLNRTSRKLGEIQENALSNLLYDLYKANGFFPEDRKSWSLHYDPRPYSKYKKKYPTIKDLKTFTEYKLKQMMFGTGAKSLHDFEKVVKSIKQIGKKFQQKEKNKFDEEKQDKLTEQIEKLCADAIASYSSGIQNMKTGTELNELIRYKSVDTIQSIFIRITNLEESGIFKPQTPNFDDNKPVHRYVIKSLNDNEQKMFVDILLDELFMKAKENGESKDLLQLVVVDEAHKFTSDEPEHIMNLIAKEARKFGFGMMWASQSFGHFPEDIIANTSTKVILGIDEMYQDVSAKKLKIQVKRFGYIQPHKTAIVQIKKKGELKNQFVDVQYKVQ